MSYDQTFKGTFTYADAHCLEAAIDAFLKREPDDDEASVLELSNLVVDKLTISIDWAGSAPASSSFGSEESLRALGKYALSGSMRTTFTMDTTERTKVPAGRRKSSAGLPPRHHRWEIFAAAKAGDAKQLRALAAKGISLDVTFSEFRDSSPLQLAARSGSAAAIDALLAAGVAVDATALHRAASAAVVERLLAAGADKNHADKDGETPLLYAIELDHFDAAHALVKAGATLGKPSNKKPKKGEPSADVRACALLAEAKQLELLRALFERGVLAKAIADPEVMSRAIAGGEQVVVDFLLQHGAKLPSDLLERAVESGSLALVELALRDPNARKRAGASNQREDAMVLAATHGHLDIMRVLADAGIPVSPKKPGPYSPLHMAVSRRFRSGPAMIAFLLERGAPIDAVDRDKTTPLTLAVHLGRYDNAKLLYLAGASPDAIDRADIYGDEIAEFWKRVGTKKPKTPKTPKAVATRTVKPKKSATPTKAKRKR